MWLRLLIILNFSFLIFNCHSYGQRPIGIAFYDVDRIYDTVPALFYDDADYTPEGVCIGPQSVTRVKSATRLP